MRLKVYLPPFDLQLTWKASQSPRSFGSVASGFQMTEGHEVDSSPTLLLGGVAAESSPQGKEDETQLRRHGFEIGSAIRRVVG